MNNAAGGLRPNILVFDSGVGGLSILHEIRSLLPFAGFVYVSDNEAFPYGEMNEKQLVARVKYVIGQLVERYHPDLLVIACNTASTVALPHLRASIPLPVVGVVPAIKPAAFLSRTKTIGLLATNATVNRPYTLDLIAQYAEEKLRSQEIDLSVIDDVISRLFECEGGDSLDTVVLGCTHFPLLVDELAARAPREIAWIDSGASIAQRVKVLLEDEQPKGTLAEDVAVFTKRTPDVLALAPALAMFGFQVIHYLST